MRFLVSVVHMLALCVSVVLPASAAAQQVYPSKPIRLIVPFPPGGSIVLLGGITGWGSQPLISTPDQFAALMAADFTKFAEIIKTANIKPD